MNKKPNFDKLRLGKTSRKKNSCISRFFSQSAGDSDSKDVLDQDIPPLKKLKENDNIISSCSMPDVLSEEKSISNDFCDNSNFPKSGDNFLPPPKSKLKPDIQRENKTSITKFFNQSGSDNDFDIPKQKRIIPNRAKIKSRNNPPIKKPKKQTKIKSAFLKSEEIFSEIIAQHSIADNVNSDELQLALAISRSEVDINNSFTEIAEDDFGKNLPTSSNNIRTKLQEFGFKTSTNDRDYDISLYLPAKKKTKWANKFTPLTLRDPEKQIKKLEDKVEKVLSRQLTNKKEVGSQTEFILLSGFLKNFESGNDSLKKLHYSDEALLSKYYVLDIFSPSTVKMGYLLKDYRKIPGRDLSPIMKSKIQKDNICQKITNDELSGSAKSACKNLNIDNHSISAIEPHVQSNISAELPSEAAKISLVSPKNSIYCCNPIETFNTPKEQTIDEDVAHKILSSKSEIFCPRNVQSEVSPSEKVKYSREASPDLFAECELSASEENIYTKIDESVNIQEDSDIQQKGNNGELIKDGDVITYEKYSSDEVKICGAEFNENNLLESTEKFKNANVSIEEKIFVDLTADSDSNPEETIAENEHNKYSDCATNIDYDQAQYSSQPVSQESSPEYCCIILSDDDEVNYSIKVANKISEDNVVDITFSSSSENNASEEGSPSQSTHNIWDKNQTGQHTHNFSFIQLLGEDEIESGIKREESFEFTSPTKSQRGESPRAKKIMQAKRSLSFSKSLVFDNKDKAKNVNGVLTATTSKTRSSDSMTFEDLNLIAYELEEKKLSNPSTSYKFDIENIQRNSISISEVNTTNSSKKLRNNSFDLDEIEQLIHAHHREEAYGTLTNKSSHVLHHLGTQLNTVNHECNNLRNKSSYKNSNHNKTLSDSFIMQENATSTIFKRYSTCRKFNEFLEEDPDFSDVDEIDKLVHGSPYKKLLPKKPDGIDKLLNADLSFTQNVSPRKYVHDDKVYLVRTENISQEPDYERMDTPTRLKELYKYGLKPLKKKQAVKILQYIYNQTHPFIIENNDDPISEEDHIHIMEDPYISAECEKQVNSSVYMEAKYNNFKLQDCFSEDYTNNYEVIPEVNHEELIFQTNTRSKVQTVQLPFHIAWYNLVKSSNKLREAVLHYEPIDLQEIFLFFKKLGYRYDPKDMKRFFDRRCILFRYDLSDGTSNRHIRKSKKALSQKSRR